METEGKPGVAALNGAGARRRSRAGARLSPPDPGRRSKAASSVARGNVGLLPGGGGVTRTVRGSSGSEVALMTVAVAGTRFKADTAEAIGLVDELVGSRRSWCPPPKAWSPRPTLARDRTEPGASLGRQGLQAARRVGLLNPPACRHPAVTAGVLKKQLGRNRCRRRAPFWTRRSRVPSCLRPGASVESRYFTRLVTDPVAQAI